MAAYPEFGGYNSVAILDWGQATGIYHTASQAHSTNRLTQQPLQVATSDITLPESDQTFKEIMGFQRRLVIIEGVIRADLATRLDTIEAEIETYVYGTWHNPITGERLRTPATMAKAQPTRLSWTSTRIIGLRVVLRAYERIGRRATTGIGSYPVWQQFRMSFEVLE